MVYFILWFVPCGRAKVGFVFVIAVPVSILVFVCLLPLLLPRYKTVACLVPILIESYVYLSSSSLLLPVARLYVAL